MSTPLRLRTKLLVSYVVLGLCITALSLAGGRAIQQASQRSVAHGLETLRRATEVASIVNGASEEGFSFVLVGDRDEKRQSLAKLGLAVVKARDLGEDAEDAEEQASTRGVASALAQLRLASTRMFAEYEQWGAVDRETYDEYEAAIDAVGDGLLELQKAIEARSARDVDRAGHVSDALTVCAGLVAALFAFALGLAFSRRLTAPVLFLRDVVAAFGRGEPGVVAPPAADDELGDLSRAFGVMMATTRHHIEAIQHGQRRLVDVFASIEELLLVADDSGKVLEVNPACCRVSGLTEEQLVGKALAAVIPAVAGHADDGRACLVPTRDRNATLVGADGHEVHVRLSLARLRGHDGDGWVCVAQDLTQRRRLEAELRQSQKLEAIGRLASGVAHDFNNMLSVVLGYTSMLLDGVTPDDPTFGPLTEVKAAGERSVDLTRQLLAFSQQETLATQVVDVREALHKLVRMVRPIVGDDIVLTSRLAPVACHAELEPGQLEQVVMNLVVNARDAMPRGGTLTVETRVSTLSAGDSARLGGLSPGKYTTLSIEDTGTGMDAATLERIFEPFFTTKPQGQGTGLGLSSVFGIVQRAHGHVHVASELGVGTTFTIYLPEASPQPPVAAVRPRLSDPAAPPQTILLVEDEEAVRGLVGRVLRGRGYRVLSARDADEATALCADEGGTIDLLLTDVMMPRVNGRELARRLVASRPDLRVLYMSGYSDAGVDAGSSRAPSAFLQKPITPDALARSVRRALGTPTPALAS